MKSPLLIGLLSFAIGLNTALLAVTVVKVNRLEDRLALQSAGREARAESEGAEAGGGERGPEKFMLWGLPQVDPDRLGLSEPQRQQVKDLKEAWKQDELERRQALLERRDQMPDLFENDEVTMEDLLPFLDQAHEESKARMEALLRSYRAYQEILTPEQQAQFKVMIREQKERHHAMRREARLRIEKFREMREGGEGSGADGRSRGERIRRLVGRDGPAGETNFGPGAPPMPPGGPMMEGLPPEGEMPGETGPSAPMPGPPY